jgi:putative acetyltransferase
MSETPSNDGLRITLGWPDKEGALDALYRAAFPEEDLLPLLADLSEDRATVRSLCGLVGEDLVAHCVFTLCTLGGEDQPAALLGPLAVAPRWQRKGFGTALMRHGFKTLGDSRVSQIFVLGDPNYYRPIGFRAEEAVRPPFPLPPDWREAWQSLILEGQAPSNPGKLIVPKVWRRPELWAP